MSDVKLEVREPKDTDIYLSHGRTIREEDMAKEIKKPSLWKRIKRFFKRKF